MTPPGKTAVARPTVKCIECGESIRLDARPRLYCSDRCRQVVKFVHYGRRVLRDGRIDDPLVQEALQMRMAHILGGGYHETERTLPAATRAAVFARDGGTCRICGAPATDIDHVAGDSPDPANLRALCRACNMAEAEAGFVPATPAMQREADRICDRVRAAEPLRPHDDERDWPARYRALAAEQRVMIPLAGRPPHRATRAQRDVADWAEALGAVAAAPKTPGGADLGSDDLEAWIVAAVDTLGLPARRRARLVRAIDELAGGLLADAAPLDIAKGVADPHLAQPSSGDSR